MYSLCMAVCLQGTLKNHPPAFCASRRKADARAALQDGRFTVFGWSPCEQMVYANRIETLLLQVNQKVIRPTNCPVRFAAATDPELMYPKPEVGIPALFRTCCARELDDVGLFRNVRLKILKNSARICSDIFSRSLNIRPRLACSSGRRCHR